MTRLKVFSRTFDIFFYVLQLLLHKLKP
jgi:hypothetical protein